MPNDSSALNGFNQYDSLTKKFIKRKISRIKFSKYKIFIA